MHAVAHTTDCFELTLRPLTEPLFEATHPVGVSLRAFRHSGKMVAQSLA